MYKCYKHYPIHGELILWSHVLLEKLIVTQLIKTFPDFHGTWRFIIVFTRAHF